MCMGPEIFVLDYDSLSYLLFLFFWLGFTFPLVAIDIIAQCMKGLIT